MPESHLISPIFPLPNLVFFPNTMLPLHVFEPRYRSMTADAIEGNRIITITQLMPGWEKNYEGNPPVYRTATAGFLTEYEQVDHGRFNIVLDGFSRVRILEEIPNPGKNYRLVRCSVLEDEDPEGHEEREALNHLMAMMHRILELRPELQENGRRVMTAVNHPAAFSHLLSAFLGATFDVDPYERQCLLDEDNLHRRLLLLGILASRILGILTGQGNATSDDRDIDDLLDSI